MNDELIDRFLLLLRMLGAQGRRERLFGSCMEPALEVFSRCAVGSCMPVVYLELPLLGEPRFDVQVCLNRADVMGVRELPPGAPEVLGPLLGWLRGSGDCPGVDLAFDVSAEELRTPQVMALMRDGVLDDAEGFFAAAGDPMAAERFRKGMQGKPKGWRAWYAGFAPQRQGRPVRLDFHISPKAQRAYAQGVRSFGDDLHSMGYETGPAQLAWCLELLRLPFLPNLQLDVMDDGAMGPVLGFSVAMPHWGPSRSREELDHGGLHAALSLVEGWGLSDSRWLQVAGCCIGAKIEKPGHQDMQGVAVRCVPTFVKVRMTGERLLDAKAYIMCMVSDMSERSRLEP